MISSFMRKPSGQGRTRVRTLLMLLALPALLSALMIWRGRLLATVGLVPRVMIDCSHPQRLGDAYGGWELCPPVPKHGLRGALVYTVGVGRNIEWDKAMIKAFGTVHHGWDPTPTALDFVTKKPVPDGFHFHPIGMAPRDGNLTLKLPTGNHDSYTVMEHSSKAQNGTVVNVPVLSVQSMMEKLEHARLAILKIDIEGAEFDVINEWQSMGYRVPTDQLLIEFHERYFTHQADWRQLVPRAIKSLDALGFLMVHHVKLEYTFANRDVLVNNTKR